MGGEFDAGDEGGGCGEDELIRQCDNETIRQCDNSTMRQCDNTTIRRFSDSYI